MSDKSFGDFANRNVMKNPLLSTAVTGLSIEDLTQNAVLLPVGRNQPRLGTSHLSSEQNEDNTRTSDSSAQQNLSNYPFGDAAFGNVIVDNNLNIRSDNRDHIENAKSTQIASLGPTTTGPIVKSVDEFDVNEYFARLHGSRYISAPVNMKEDQNLKIEADAEENLEEINLNESADRVIDEQQSLTADIAQNISQLPTVLPQVASVVFNSFTNMLNYKSREQSQSNRDDNASSTNVASSNVDWISRPPVDVTLMGASTVDSVKELSPPPKEHPHGGSTSYRINTKKKVYAQVPGLSFNDNQSIVPCNPPPVNQIDNPSYFVPNCEKNIFSNSSVTYLEENLESDAGNEKEINSAFSQLSLNVKSSGDEILSSNYYSVTNVAMLPHKPIDNKMSQQQALQVTNQEHNTSNNGSVTEAFVSTILPPPTFTKFPRRDSELSTGKSLLPPSIARRIAAHQPVIKTETSSVSFDSNNIFVPTVFSSQKLLKPVNESPQSSLSNIASPLNNDTKVSVMLGVSPASSDKEIAPSTPRITDPSICVESFTTIAFDSTTLLPELSTEQASSLVTNTPKTSVNENDEQIQPPPMFFNPSTFSTQSAISDVPNDFQQQSSFSIEPSDFSRPNVMFEQSNNESSKAAPATSFYSEQEDNIQKIPKIPKLSGNTNFRLNKKKPQYYSGPMLGVSTVNNSTMPPVEGTNVYQGALYDPNKNQLPDVVSNPEKLISPFDIMNSTTALTSSNNNIHLNHSVHDTVFDVSRKDNKFQAPEESKSYGFIGSLKSTWSLIDINKIQNSVTTFFDPAYDNTNKDCNIQQDLSLKENRPYSQTNLEILVPGSSSQLVQSPNLIQNYSIDQSSYHYQPQQVYKYESAECLSDIKVSPQSHHDVNNMTTIATTLTENIKSNLVECYDELKKLHVLENGQTLHCVQLKDSVQNETKMLDVADETSDLMVSSTISSHEIIVTHKDRVDPIYGADKYALTTLKESTPDHRSYDKENRFFDISNKLQSVHEIACHYTEAELDRELVTLSEPSRYGYERSVLCTEASQNVPTFSLQKYSNPVENKYGLEENIENLNLKETNIPYIEIHTGIEKTKEKDTGHIIKSDALIDCKQKVEDISELDICETCREVNKTEERNLEPESLTAQLIENITAPIQLSNPVETVFTEDVDTERINFDIDECAKISRITELTLEAIHLQTAMDMLEESQINSNYRWSTDNMVPPIISHAVDDSKTIQSQKYSDHTCTPPNIDTIRFFGDNTYFNDSIPKNASDEIKACLKGSQGDTVVISKQINNSTTPPEEDLCETRSDETGGLDVHSIEQDARNDFPVYDEFVIEPSVSDDDKIEFRDREKSDSSEKDTFINRIENFKKLEKNHSNKETNEDSNSQNLQTPTSISQTFTIPSYFDTGNYAVETHYKNSLALSSPVLVYYHDYKPMRIPPGFEEEYQQKVQTEDNENLNEPHIPETSTQTRHSTILTYTRAQTMQSNITTTSQSASPLTLTSTLETISNCNNTSISSGASEEKMITPVTSTVTISTSEGTMLADSIVTVTTTKNLPDPLTFFSSTNTSHKGTSDTVHSNFNRLASYFASPPKPDHSKSFFELSQSQNHYRHSPSKNGISPKNIKNHCMDDKHVKYFTNYELIKDLSSYHSSNYIPKTDVATTINYFTVKYCNNESNVNIGEPENTIFETRNSKAIEIDNNNLCKENHINMETENMCGEGIFDIRNCKYCCDIIPTNNIFDTKLADFRDFKVKKALDSQDTESRKDTEANMNQRKDVSRKTPNVSLDIDPGEDTHSDPVHSVKEVIIEVKESRPTAEYVPVKHHWFYRVDADEKSIWRGFSTTDSDALEQAFNSPDLNESTVVATDGGRFDVNVVGRLRVAVYWNDKPTNVRRCSWFYKGTSRYVPYTESIAEKLEEEYRRGITSGDWHRRLMLSNNEAVVMHGPSVMTHIIQDPTTEPFPSPNLVLFGKRVYRNPLQIRVARDQPTRIDHLILLVHGAGEWRSQREKLQSSVRTRVVRRGHDESEVEETEPSSVDHLLLFCHGVGSACDMRFRRVEEVVDDFRATSLQLIQSHYKSSYEDNLIGRVEVLPISWHSTLHSGESGVDRRLEQITLDSIPRLRSFTNDTVLDVLFYTSPVYCQVIIDTVCKELNRVYNLFRSRNPEFQGGVSLGGHSLGSVILYDLLCHQEPEGAVCSTVEKRYMSGCAGTGQPSVRYPRLEFAPTALYALGSPIAIFEVIRGVELLGKDFSLPTCKSFFNIFHPYDPIAYRIEPLIDPTLRDIKPYLIPHHKGRKRMHLELKETMARVGADLKQRLIESIKATWFHMWGAPPPSGTHLEKVVEEELEKQEMLDEAKEEAPAGASAAALQNVTADMLGALNRGRRVDYVLQEAPLEMINEYLFAMRSHVCYWESEDTMLLMLREIYDALGVRPDSTVPQQSMTVQRVRAVKREEIYSMEEPSTSKVPL